PIALPPPLLGLYFPIFFFSCHRPPRALHSFPTRRSSDLAPQRLDQPRQLVRHPRPVGAVRDAVRGESPVARGVSLEHRRLHERRSEEHTSELQSQSNLVCRLLLEKKKKKKN